MDLALLEMCATLARNKGRKTQNSAIMSTDTYDKETTKMYANITDIVQLQYISSFEDHQCVVPLCCRWYNLFSRIAKPRTDDYFKSINVKVAYQTNEPFILANQATQIFFLEDTFDQKPVWFHAGEVDHGIHFLGTTAYGEI